MATRDGLPSSHADQLAMAKNRMTILQGKANE